MDVFALAQKYLKPKHEPAQQDSSDDEEDAAPKKCTSGAGGGMGLGTPKQCEADLKEQRKSNKKTAKLLQRAKRQGLQVSPGLQASCHPAGRNDSQLCALRSCFGRRNIVYGATVMRVGSRGVECCRN